MMECLVLRCDSCGNELKITETRSFGASIAEKTYIYIKPCECRAREIERLNKLNHILVSIISCG